MFSRLGGTLACMHRSTPAAHHICGEATAAAAEQKGLPRIVTSSSESSSSHATLAAFTGELSADAWRAADAGGTDCPGPEHRELCTGPLTVPLRTANNLLMSGAQFPCSCAAYANGLGWAADAAWLKLAAEAWGWGWGATGPHLVCAWSCAHDVCRCALVWLSIAIIC